MTIDKTMFADEVRDYCIKNKCYTKGNNADYSAMLDLADKANSDADIIAVCHDIWNHSDNEQYINYGGTFRSVKTESELMKILQKNEADIISGKYAKRRSVIHKSSSKIVFSDNSNLYKTDRITNNYTFKTEKLTYYVREIVTEWEGNTSHTFMCYAA